MESHPQTAKTGLMFYDTLFAELEGFGRRRMISKAASKSNELLGRLESCSQRGVPMAGVDQSHGHPQRFFGSEHRHVLTFEIPSDKWSHKWHPIRFGTPPPQKHIA